MKGTGFPNIHSLPIIDQDALPLPVNVVKGSFYQADFI